MSDNEKETYRRVQNDDEIIRVVLHPAGRPEPITFGSCGCGFESAPDRHHPNRPLAARQICSPFSAKLAFWGHFEGLSDNLRTEIVCQAKRLPRQQTGGLEPFS